ncbi:MULTISPECIES: hypothetical protein [unclassified Mesorhizobium]|uniref:hypothetical protein n=1 Tax=unclassified Mesorhizobium TaxID=325217 RepID=UPI0010934750|nr:MULTISPECIES: hypothetical protein [unclassified Mesorhizobium]TGS46020.1 hypothetical protein EN825_10365 [Mesorhizobium sp. M8A.F.Ca.ET.182.01.1.1]TGS81475.1 hypothetical protein EN824_10580 [Mesorhizobium sp. M8A.F.Ca.ET.181.01.1.1]
MTFRNSGIYDARTDFAALDRRTSAKAAAGWDAAISRTNGETSNVNYESADGFAWVHVDDGSDLADRLPAEAKAKLLRLREAKIAAQDLAAPMFERIHEKRMERLNFWTVASKREHDFHLSNLFIAHRHHGVELPPEGKAALAAIDQDKAKLARLDEELARLEAQNTHKARRAQTLGALIDNNLERFLLSLRPGTRITEFDGIVPKLRKGETASEAIERTRNERASLLADLNDLQAKPITAQAAKAKAREHIELLANDGKPSVLSLLDHGEGIGFMRLNSRAGSPFDSFNGDLSKDARRALSLVAWVCKDQLIKAINAEIDAADTGAGISDKDRTAAEFQINATLQSLEREEEALIEMAEANGQLVERRIDADSAAVLGIVVSNN